MNIFALDLATRTGGESKVDENRKEMCIFQSKTRFFQLFQNCRNPLSVKDSGLIRH
jgi:hypothetical protein